MTQGPVLSLLAAGYAVSVLVETPVLLAGLSARHGAGVRLLAGLWLTACTYPTVTLVLPWLLAGTGSRALMLAAGETFAPAAECLLFWAAFGDRRAAGRPSMRRDFAAITLANVASFAVGELLYQAEWLPGNGGAGW